MKEQALNANSRLEKLLCSTIREELAFKARFTTAGSEYLTTVLAVSAARVESAVIAAEQLLDFEKRSPSGRLE